MPEYERRKTMKRTITSVLAVILSLVMMLVPVLASAESDTAVITIYDPYFAVEGQEIDLSGLALELGIQETGLGLKLLANNVEALKGFAGFDMENGLIAGLSGMQYAFGMSMEDIYALIEQVQALLASEGIDINSLMSTATDLSALTFSDESVAALEEYATELLSVIISGEPEETTFDEDGEVAAQQISFVITCDQLAELAARIGAVIDSNEMATAYIAEYIGGESITSVSELLSSAVAELNGQIEGRIYITETENTYIRVYFEDAENTDDYVALYVDAITDENETYYYCTLTPSTEEGEVGLLIDFTVNEEIEYAENTYIRLWSSEFDENGEATDIFDILLSAESSLEDGIVRNDYILNIETEDTEPVVIDIFSYDIEDGISAGIYVNVTEAGSEEELLLGYEGAYAETGIDGKLYVSLSVDSADIINASIGISFASIEEDFSFDMSGMQMLNLLNDLNDEETMELVSNDAMTVLMNALTVVAQELPDIAALLG